MTGLIRYGRLWIKFIEFSIAKSLEFRMDFFIRVMMDVFYYAVNILFFKILFLHTAQLGGWNESQAILFIVSALMIDAINMTFFMNNQFWLPLLINKGQLDYYLIRPVSPFFMLSTREFALTSFINFLMTIGLFVWALSNQAVPLSGIEILCLVGFIINGAALFHGVCMLFVVPSFWTHNSGFRDLGWQFHKLLERPDAIYPAWARRLFIFGLPYFVMISLPLRWVFEGRPWDILALILGVSAGFWIVFSLIWKKALRSYSSASS